MGDATGSKLEAEAEARLEQEGVIKFVLRFTVGEPPVTNKFDRLNGWRRVCYEMGLIGQEAGRYGGYGFGNLSCRLPAWPKQPKSRPFVISGTQTGGLACLGREHYTTVVACDPELNQVTAVGPIKPSSESMTHAILYQLDKRIRCVIHAHSPDIWLAAERLGLPQTRADVPYGTPEMVGEVRRLWRDTAVAKQGIFSMAGHEDGLVVFGHTPDKAGAILLQTLAEAQPMR